LFKLFDEKITSMEFARKDGGVAQRIYPPAQKATVFKTFDECAEGTLRSSNERSGICFGGFRLPARSRFGKGRPYEACGGATGFSPWGLHQKAIWDGKGQRVKMFLRSWMMVPSWFG